MSASLLSSFLIFISAGLWESLVADKTGTWFGHINDDIVINIIRISICANAIYFYYCAALVELHKPTRELLQNNGRGEWITRLVNQTMILGIWPAMHNSLLIFAAYMVILYCSFLIWGFQTVGHLPPTSMFVRLYDGLGAVVSLLLILDVGFYLRQFNDPKEIPAMHWTVVGILCALYIGIAVFGCARGFGKGFNPLSSQYYTRRALH